MFTWAFNNLWSLKGSHLHNYLVNYRGFINKIFESVLSVFLVFPRVQFFVNWEIHFCILSEIIYIWVSQLLRFICNLSWEKWYYPTLQFPCLLKLHSIVIILFKGQVPLQETFECILHFLIAHVIYIIYISILYTLIIR